MKVKAKDVEVVLLILEQIGEDEYLQEALEEASMDGSLNDFLMLMEASGAWEGDTRTVLDKALFVACLKVTY